jgi:hypothetical protein
LASNASCQLFAELGGYPCFILKEQLKELSVNGASWVKRM